MQISARAWDARQVLPLLLFVLALVWYGAYVVRFRTHGALGDDPATYVQMGRDLATRGAVAHEFPLFTNLYNKGLSWYAFVTPGYHVVTETGFVAPNFAFGLPLLLALVLRLFDEGAVYWATPLMGALSLVVTFAIGNELWRDMPARHRHLMSALAVLVLATTPKQLELVLVPMSDVPTQLFCLLAIWCALRVTRGTPAGSFLFAALCGISLGIAYLIRHSALIVVVPLAVIAIQWASTTRRRILLGVVAVGMLVLTIQPDIIYRVNVLGSVFAVESPESSQLVWLDAPRQFFQILYSLVTLDGWGPLVLLAPLGWWVLIKQGNRFVASLLAVWTFVFVLFHAPLKLTGVFENDLRYMLPAYPAIALSIGAGADWIVTRVWEAVRDNKVRFAKRSWLFYGAGILALILIAIATRAVVSPERFVRRTYGWMDETSRQDLDAVSLQLPANAVLGVSDQLAGAALLYTQHEMFRPASFTDPPREFPEFLQAMKQANRAVYLLGTWNCPQATDASENLPDWLGNYATSDQGLEIRDLPYACSQQLYKLNGE